MPDVEVDWNKLYCLGSKLHKAAASNSTTELAEALAGGIDVNSATSYEEAGSGSEASVTGVTALHLAARNGAHECIRLLLSARAEPDLRYQVLQRHSVLACAKRDGRTHEVIERGPLTEEELDELQLTPKALATELVVFGICPGRDIDCQLKVMGGMSEETVRWQGSDSHTFRPGAGGGSFCVWRPAITPVGFCWKEGASSKQAWLAFWPGGKRFTRAQYMGEVPVDWDLGNWQSRARRLGEALLGPSNHKLPGEDAKDFRGWHALRAMSAEQKQALLLEKAEVSPDSEWYTDFLHRQQTTASAVEAAKAAAQTAMDLPADGGEADAAALVVAAFQDWDTNGDGRISKAELVAVMKKLWSGVTDETLDGLFKHCDCNKDGFIDYQEFCAFVMR